MNRIFFIITMLSVINVFGQTDVSGSDPDDRIHGKNSYGYLKVFTVLEQDMVDYINEKVVYNYHKSYHILNDSGREIMKVSRSYNTPQKVKLPAGTYLIVAEVTEGEKDIFEVQLEAGKLFEIDYTMIKHGLDVTYK
ncbi:MAG: hypothetical protein R6W90_08410 [Ignavibacteriaceae bacterium]